MSGPISENWDAEIECPLCRSIDTPRLESYIADRRTGTRRTAVYCDLCNFRMPDYPGDDEDE